MACGEPDYYKVYYTDAEGNDYSIGDFPILKPEDWELIHHNSGDFIYTDSTDVLEWPNPERDVLKKLLEELANTPVPKIPIWIEQHKEELAKLGVNIKEMKKR